MSLFLLSLMSLVLSLGLALYNEPRLSLVVDITIALMALGRAVVGSKLRRRITASRTLTSVVGLAFLLDAATTYMQHFGFLLHPLASEVVLLGISLLVVVWRSFRSSTAWIKTNRNKDAFSRWSLFIILACTGAGIVFPNHLWIPFEMFLAMCLFSIAGTFVLEDEERQQTPRRVF